MLEDLNRLHQLGQEIDIQWEKDGHRTIMSGPPKPPAQQPPPKTKTTVLLTGCSEGGIGFALAQEYRRRGCHVIATARNPAKMQALLAQQPGRDADLTLLPLDVADPTSIEGAVQAVTDLLAAAKDGCYSLDILVNNAGGGYQAPLLDADLDEARRLFDVNVWGVLAVTQAFAPLLVASASAGRRPRVVNIGSVVGVVPIPWQGICKFAIYIYIFTIHLCNSLSLASWPSFAATH